MSEPEETAFRPDEFSGVVRLFPLPNLVLFPHVCQLLHVFEPRYRQLVDEAVATDRMIAMAVLEPGWEGDYEGRPPLCSTACLGRITTHRREPDGRFYLLLEGVARVKLIDELPPKKLFREARATLVEDVYPSDGEPHRPALQQRLLDSLRSCLPDMPEVREPLEQLFKKQLSLGMLTDMASYTLELELELKARLLAELDVDRRAEMLLEVSTPGQDRPNSARFEYPPDFSLN